MQDSKVLFTMSGSGDDDNIPADPNRGEDDISDGERHPNRTNRRNRENQEDGLQLRMYFEDRFNELISSNKRTQRRLTEQEEIRKPLKYKGNEMQLLFNSKAISELTEAKQLIRTGSLQGAESTIKQLNHRNELIKIADRSPAGVGYSP